MSDDIGLTGPEQRAILIMTRWAHEVGLRRRRWSLPNDASWPHSHLAGLPVRHDGLPNQYDLLARAPWRPERVVCSLHRFAGGYEVMGVPGEEWLRQEPEAHPPPVRSRPRVRLTAAAVGLLVPAGALGGLAVAITANQQDAAPPPVAIGPTRIEPAPAPPLPANADEWAAGARVRLAAMSQQLERLAAAESTWAALPPERRAGDPPAPVQELQSDLTELTQRRAALAAELDAWDALRESRSDLTATEERLAEVRNALALGDTTASEQLRAQADRLARQSTEQRGQLVSWQRSVDAAMAAPPPEPVDAAPTADAVLALAEQDPSPAPEREAPVVAAGREVEPDAEPQDGDDDPGPEPDDELEPDRDGPGPEADNDPDRNGIGVPDVINDAAPGDGERRGVSDVEATGPPDDAPAPQPEPEPDRDITGPAEVDVSPPDDVPQDRQPVAAPDAPSESRSAITPTEREQINKEINSMLDSQLGPGIDAFVANHGDELNAAVDRMEGMTLDDLVRHEGETDQELRERLTKVAEDYQRQAGPAR
ncbi:MAG: hypothetical protein GEV09_17285 [Pseudonocardiaceae bacterium]|nr:hypothetical protein [Pseudonocardiaceae bacterium]